MIDGTTTALPRWQRWLQAATLVGVGCMQLTGDLIGNDFLKGLGAISHASPAPKVFTSQNGYETYSPTFTISAFTNGKPADPIVLTPQVNAKVRGPYNRRNAYGAAISYGPVLAVNPATQDMFKAAFAYGFCNPRGVAHDIGLPTSTRYRVDIRVNAKNSADWPNQFDVNCNSGNVTYRNQTKES